MVAAGSQRRGVREWAWPCANKTLFTETVRGPDLARTSYFTYPCSKQGIWDLVLILFICSRPGPSTPMKNHPAEKAGLLRSEAWARADRATCAFGRSGVVIMSVPLPSCLARPPRTEEGRKETHLSN